ncbi:MAG: hypothetical protein ACOX7D_03825 [Alphaproteobacteria bacterium]|jgi:hypothetical protein|uniref:hypothetical protein n=1 Tax=Methanoculleus sp. UBA413 TaxID=1915509 RepID=UPI00181A8320|nr:hypothetical protein [Methanoculleus sp. UBA413]HHV41909.1 hypothetical protein [Clostridiaceae bacterium]
MPFIARAQSFLVDQGPLSNHKKNPEMVETVRFMLEHAVGVDHAIATQRIVDHLQENGYDIRNKEDWQITVLGPLRENGIIIGSKRSKGMFLISSEFDARIVVSQMQERISKESERLQLLIDMVSEVGWSPN